MATEYADIVEPEDDDEQSPFDRLEELLEADNIAEMLSDEELGKIAQLVRREYDIDKQSQSEWEEINKDALDLALQIATTKNYPWPGAANIKFPLLTTAAIQFAARAYPAIVRDGEMVKARIIGEDEDGKKRDRGERVSRHMSWQLSTEMDEWEEETDKLLHVLPITGMVYRKVLRDLELGRNRSEMIMPDKVVINSGARSFKTVPRVTQELPLYPLEIEERIRGGKFIRVELGNAEDGGDDDDAPHEFLEQHRRLDLDEDGYAEPYIVTMHAETDRVVRIVANFDVEDIIPNEQGEIARINQGEYFIKYGLLPNPGGEWHDIGLGYLMRPISEAVNSTLNQMLDAGHLQNVGGGFIGAGARLRGGQIRRRIGEYVTVDVSGQALRENIVDHTHPGPSPVLFQLLGLLIEAAKDISSVKDVMTGEARGRNESPTTVMALIEQGMQVFTAIYKRIFRALKQEYALLYALNARHLDQETYFQVLDEQEAVAPEDYAEGDFDIVPVADPQTATNMQRLARAEFLMQFKDDPYFDPKKVRERFFEAAGIDNIDDLVADQVAPNPEMLERADKIDIEKRRLQLDEIELEGKLAKTSAEIIKLLADAEGVEAGQQMAAYRELMKQLNDRARIVVQMKGIEAKDVDRGGVSSVAGPSGNGSVPVVSEGAA